MQTLAAMPNHQGNGRNVSLPDENRPSWRPQDENVTPRIRRSMDEDDRDTHYRYGAHWEDRDWENEPRDRYRGDRSGTYSTRGSGYPGSFEERSRGTEDRHGGRGGSAYWQDRNERYPERGYNPERYGAQGGYGGGRGWEAERIGSRPRGYGYDDGDRPNLGTGGPMQHTGYSRDNLGYQSGAGMMRGSEHHPGGHRGKGPQGYQRSDERLREIVCEMLTEDDRIDATDVEVSVKGGEVMLGGTVPERHMKRLAEDVIEHVTGIKDVQNHIKVK